MTKLIASVKDQTTKEITLITSTEHKTKSAFAKELKGGYTVRFIATEETFDDECEKFYEKQENARKMAQVKRDAKKETERIMKELQEKAELALKESKEKYRKDNFINEECAKNLTKMYANMGLNISI